MHEVEVRLRHRLLLIQRAATKANLEIMKEIVIEMEKSTTEEHDSLLTLFTEVNNNMVIDQARAESHTLFLKKYLKL